MGSLGAFSMLSANAAAAFSAFFAVLPPEAQADNSRSKLRHKESITVIRFFIKSSAFLKMVIFFYLDYKGKCAAASRRKLTEFSPPCFVVSSNLRHMPKICKNTCFLAYPIVY